MEEFRDPRMVDEGSGSIWTEPHKKAQEVQHQACFRSAVEKKVEKPVEAATAAKTADAPVEEVKTPEVKAPEVEIPEVKIPEMKQQPEEIKRRKSYSSGKGTSRSDEKPEPVQEPKTANAESTIWRLQGRRHLPATILTRDYSG
ncbi:MAG: hypothetical protein ACLR6J_06120 [Parabacteroides merdae]